MDILLVESYEGGMENWGHILISSEIAENGDDSHLLHLIAHELTHHWIGNIVSVSSWSHICLQVCVIPRKEGGGRRREGASRGGRGRGGVYQQCVPIPPFPPHSFKLSTILFLFLFHCSI